MTVDSHTSRIYVKQPNQTQKRKCCIVEPQMQIKVPARCKPTQDSVIFNEMAKTFQLNQKTKQKKLVESKVETIRSWWNALPKLPKFSFHKAFDISPLIKCLNGKLVYTTSLVVVGTLVFGSVYASGIRMGYGVYLEGERVASVSSKEVVDIAVVKVEQKIEEISQDNYKVNAVEVKAEFVTQNSVQDTKTLEKQIIEQVDVVTQAVAIYVDGALILAVADEDAAKNVIDTLINTHKQALGDEQAIVTIKNDIKIANELVSNKKIVGFSEAYEALLGNKEEAVTVTVQEKDTFWSIAQANGVTVEQLMAANPEVVPEALKPEMSLQLNKAVSLITFKSEQVVDYVETLAFAVEEMKDEESYVGTKKIQTKGVEGQTAYKAVVIKENGVEVDKKILEEDVILQPINEVVIVGTKQPEVKAKAYPSVSSTGFIRPYRGTLTSRYGGRRRGFHTGVDWSGRVGDPIVASAGGTVTYAGWSGGYGYLVKIDHGNGYETYYGHNSANLVKRGQTVVQGQVIARLGSTGNSTGPHCHFEIRKNGQHSNPLNYVK